MIPQRSLQQRFFLAGSLLAVITIGTGLWSIATFVRLSQVVDRSLHENEQTLDLAAGLANDLEREDDALLLALNDRSESGQAALVDERRRSDAGAERLRLRLGADGPDGLSLAAEAGRQIAAYRRAGTELLTQPRSDDAVERYHDRVNPLLRRAVQACGAIRERNFEAMRRAGIQARDQARHATWVVALVCLTALLLATVVAAWLARSVVNPVRRLTESVEALRQGEFNRRVELTSRQDELGQLAEGFNRMAEALAEYRRSSLGELIAAKTTLEATLNALPDAVFVVAPDGALVSLNPPARTILTAKGVATARRIDDLPLGPAHREGLRAALAGRPILPSQADFGQVLQARLGGEDRKFLITAGPISEFTPGRTGAVVVLDDVTEFARLDELRTELVAVASHELKTPLTTLRMSLMLLGESAEGWAPRQRQMLQTALLGCEELGNTIDELLDVTRIEAGQLRLDLAAVDLEDVLHGVLKLFSPRFEDAGIRLEIQAAARPDVIQGDALRLRTVIANLLSNALKYSPPGGSVVIRIASRQNAVTPTEATLQFSVTDEGPGVPAAFLDRVFEKFFRVEHHLNRSCKDVRGTGIGLYLCREVIRAHGGSIWCEPKPGALGTSFVFEIAASR